MKKTLFGKKLIEALTIDEVIQLIDALLASMDEEHIEQVLSNLNNENIEDITSQLIFSDKSTKVVSDNKFLQEWKELWRSWNSCVEKLGDEKEEYVHQENDWETPYFASHDFAEDLEEIAVKMLPLLDRISQMQEEEDLFEEALQEVEFGIMEYPEWMGAEYGDCCVSVAVTECMVKWAWINADSVETFLDRLIETESSLNIISLDHQGYINCLNELSEDNQKEIYDYINQNRELPTWKERLDDDHCLWHGIYHDFSSVFDQESHLETCRRLLHKNWKYGIPLVKDCLDNDRLLEAEKISRQTINSFLEREEKKLWDPEKSLLISEIRYVSSSPFHSIIELMQNWMDIADKTNMPSKVNALKLQIATYETPYDWDKVVAVIEKINASAVSELIEEWKSFCSHRSILQSDNPWVKWLMDATLDDDKDASWLFGKIKNWLTALSDTPKELTSQQTNLFELTFDIADISDLKKQYPLLFKAIYHPLERHSQTPSILKWLKKSNGITFAPLLKDFWVNQVPNFLPDPVNAHKSDYREHAKWLAALSELNPKEYKTILTLWKKKHHRRRNLWKAIQEIGIDV